METTSAVFDRDQNGGSIPPPPSRDRDGLSALERKALYRVHTELPAMPASLVVQILLWFWLSFRTTSLVSLSIGLVHLLNLKNIFQVNTRKSNEKQSLR